MRRVLVAAVGLALLPFTAVVRPAEAADPCAAWMDPHDSADHRANALVAAMTQDQKMGMLTFSDPPWFAFYGTAGHVNGIPGLCVPDLVLSDAGSGVAGAQIATTIFPSGVAQASTWDPTMQRRLGRAIGQEAF